MTDKPKTLRERLHAIDSWSEGGPPVNDSIDDVCRDALDQLDEMAAAGNNLLKVVEANGLEPGIMVYVERMRTALARHEGRDK